jgi:hypothetical protein
VTLDALWACRRPKRFSEGTLPARLIDEPVAIERVGRSAPEIAYLLAWRSASHQRIAAGGWSSLRRVPSAVPDRQEPAVVHAYFLVDPPLRWQTKPIGSSRWAFRSTQPGTAEF